jgi:hypothetical protein
MIVNEGGLERDAYERADPDSHITTCQAREECSQDSADISLWGITKASAHLGHDTGMGQVHGVGAWDRGMGEKFGVDTHTGC